MESNLVSVAFSPLQVKPHDSRRLRAIELLVPNVVSNFQVKHCNADEYINNARVYNIYLNAGKVFVCFSMGYGVARTALLSVQQRCGADKNNNKRVMTRHGKNCVATYSNFKHFVSAF